MNLTRVFAGAVLLATGTLAASGCSTKISDTSSGGGGGDGPPRTWCSRYYGVISQPTDGIDTMHDISSCEAGEVCARSGGSGAYLCCDTTKQPDCAFLAGYPGHDGSDANVYCAPWGWERLPIIHGDKNGDGRVCKPNETCATVQASASTCANVCCDPREDPTCGVPITRCASTGG